MPHVQTELTPSELELFKRRAAARGSSLRRELQRLIRDYLNQPSPSGLLASLPVFDGGPGTTDDSVRHDDILYGDDPE